MSNTGAASVTSPSWMSRMKRSVSNTAPATRPAGSTGDSYLDGLMSDTALFDAYVEPFYKDCMDCMDAAQQVMESLVGMADKVKVVSPTTTSRAIQDSNEKIRLSIVESSDTTKRLFTDEVKRDVSVRLAADVASCSHIKAQLRRREELVEEIEQTKAKLDREKGETLDKSRKKIAAAESSLRDTNTMITSGLTGLVRSRDRLVQSDLPLVFLHMKNYVSKLTDIFDLVSIQGFDHIVGNLSSVRLTANAISGASGMAGMFTAGSPTSVPSLQTQYSSQASMDMNSPQAALSPLSTHGSNNAAGANMANLFDSDDDDDEKKKKKRWVQSPTKAVSGPPAAVGLVRAASDDAPPPPPPPSEGNSMGEDDYVDSGTLKEVEKSRRSHIRPEIMDFPLAMAMLSTAERDKIKRVFDVVIWAHEKLGILFDIVSETSESKDELEWLIVRTVIDSTAASEVGVQPGDIVTHINGQSLIGVEADDAQAILAIHPRPMQIRFARPAKREGANVIKRPPEFWWNSYLAMKGVISMPDCCPPPVLVAEQKEGTASAAVATSGKPKSILDSDDEGGRDTGNDSDEEFKKRVQTVTTTTAQAAASAQTNAAASGKMVVRERTPDELARISSAMTGDARADTLRRRIVRDQRLQKAEHESALTGKPVPEEILNEGECDDVRDGIVSMSLQAAGVTSTDSATGDRRRRTKKDDGGGDDGGIKFVVDCGLDVAGIVATLSSMQVLSGGTDAELATALTNAVRAISVLASMKLPTVSGPGMAPPSATTTTSTAAGAKQTAGTAPPPGGKSLAQVKEEDARIQTALKKSFATTPLGGPSTGIKPPASKAPPPRGAGRPVIGVSSLLDSDEEK